jgi:uncharacterized protein YbjQ (UPF0145 family)
MGFSADTPRTTRISARRRPRAARRRTAPADSTATTTTTQTGDEQMGYTAGSTEGISEHGRARLEQNREGLFTSDLSINEFVMVDEAGFDPLGMVMGNCVYHVAHQSMRQAMRNVGQNVELPLFTQALDDSRELAVQRMQAEAKDAQANGIVGVKIDEGSFFWDGHVIEFFALATSVIRAEQPPSRPTPSYVFDLGQ